VETDIGLLKNRNNLVLNNKQKREVGETNIELFIKRKYNNTKKIK